MFIIHVFKLSRYLIFLKWIYSFKDWASWLLWYKTKWWRKITIKEVWHSIFTRDWRISPSSLLHLFHWQQEQWEGDSIIKPSYTKHKKKYKKNIKNSLYYYEIKFSVESYQTVCYFLFILVCFYRSLFEMNKL